MKLGNLLLPLLMAAALYWMFSNSRRRQRAVQQIQSSVAAGAQVITTAGLYATVVEVDGDQVTLETAPGQHSRWDKRAISRVLPAEAEGDADDASAEPGDDEYEDEGAEAAGTAPASQPTAPPDRA